MMFYFLFTIEFILPYRPISSYKGRPNLHLGLCSRLSVWTYGPKEEFDMELLIVTVYHAEQPPLCITQLTRCSAFHGFVCELKRVIISQNRLQLLECLSAFRILPTIPQPLSAFFIPHFTFRVLQFRILLLTAVHALGYGFTSDRFYFMLGFCLGFRHLGCQLGSDVNFYS